MKNCPVCATELNEATKYGVQIDVCPRCRGVWLDRGELEKVIGMARDFRGMDAGREMHDEDRNELRYRKDDDDSRYGKPHGRKKKRGFLDMFEEMFD
ncbi:MAG: zf-TFIIB domain-containing protein [Thermoanaerobacterales bacterium]|nr:zf-TFIIB domain-containing protein [Bacillota bacterium]MDI6906553.1 zf-TFIIB domain-containing protein [Thermoanaerobacterales bacterium]